MSARCARPAELRETSAARPAHPTESQRLLAAITALSGQQRRVLVECYLHRASEVEAAATIHVSPTTVRSLIHEALHSLHAAVAGTEVAG
jgi:DNA-directed RNA polymerase specialized sigma24 family protein